MKNHAIKNQVIKAISGDSTKHIDQIVSERIAAMTKQPKPVKRFQPGSIVESLLAQIGIKAEKNCGCGQVKSQMNRMGWRWCWKNRRTLLDHFAREAGKQGINVRPSISSMTWYYLKTIARSTS